MVRHIKTFIMTVFLLNVSLISNLSGLVYLMLYSVHADSWFLYSHLVFKIYQYTIILPPQAFSAFFAMNSTFSAMNIAFFVCLSLGSGHLVGRLSILFQEGGPLYKFYKILPMGTLVCSRGGRLMHSGPVRTLRHVGN